MTPALLIHSGGFTSRQWRRLRQALEPTRRVIAPDLLGYGEARWPAGAPFHFQQDVDMLAAVLADVGPAHLIGHSYGGLLALQLALARPDHVRSIAVYEPVAFGVLAAPEDEDALAAIGALPAYVPDDHGVDERWLAGFVDWWNGAGAWARLPGETQQAFRDVSWKLSREVISLAADTTSRARYGSITAPTLVLAGDATQRAELRVVERLAAALPHATLACCPGSVTWDRSRTPGSSTTRSRRTLTRTSSAARSAVARARRATRWSAWWLVQLPFSSATLRMLCNTRGWLGLRPHHGPPA